MDYFTKWVEDEVLEKVREKMCIIFYGSKSYVDLEYQGKS